jgi:hypothetical protein
MSDRPTRLIGFHEGFRRLFTLFAQTNPRYFHAFLHTEIGPRYLSLPRIVLCTVGIAVFAPLLRAFLPGITFLPLYLLPFAPHPWFPWVQQGTFSIGASEFLPFWLFAAAFLITAIRRHLDGERRIIEGQPLHTYDRGAPRLFKPNIAAITVKEPLLVFALGAAWACAALFSGAFHPAFGSFLMLGALDLWLSEALIERYFSVTVRDELDEELRAAQLQRLREEALTGKRGPLGPSGGVTAQEAAGFRPAPPGKRG